MNNYQELENQLPLKKHLELLHNLKFLLDDKSIDGDDKQALTQAVHNILKKKSDTGVVVVGLRGVLFRAALSNIKKRNYKTAKSAVQLLRMNHHGNSLN